MSYSLNLGMWTGVFAVPSEIVDKHLKLAGAAQLKVILWILRHTNSNFTDEDIAQSLNMQTADVRDSIQYWIQVGLIELNNEVISPPQNSAEPAKQTVNSSGIGSAGNISVGEESPSDKKNEVRQSRAPIQPPKPDVQYLSRRMAEDKEIAYLMQAADSILGRMTSNSDKCILLNIHEYDGLPVEVILMLLQYACDIGKSNLRYIDKMAITWSDEEITTLDRAEKKIKQLTDSRAAAYRVMKITGVSEHSPTSQESSYADRWLLQWKFSDDMIRKAYEICIDKTGKYSAGYINKILESWHKSGIKTLEQAASEQDKHKKSKKQEYDNGAAYDLAAYENSDPFN